MSEISSSLLLFLSVDLVGSTAFKNGLRKKGQEQPWLQFFDSFYIDVPHILQKHIGAENSYCPKIWKTIGDEILFQCLIEDKDDSKKVILGLLDALKEYNESLILKDLTLSVKAMAWLAGFPVINAIVKIGIENDAEVDDYIGPSIDVGFRIAKYSDSRNLIISVELALVLADTLSSKEEMRLGGIFVEKEEILKGVFKGFPYPIISIKLQNEFERNRLKVFKSSKAQLVDVYEYCSEFIKLVKDPYIIVIPYIYFDNQNHYNEIPDSHIEIIRELEEKAKGDYEKGKIPEEIAESGNDILEVSDEIQRRL